MTTAFFEDIWSRNLLNLFATPLTISEYVAGLVLTSVATSLIALGVMLILATVVFGLSPVCITRSAPFRNGCAPSGRCCLLLMCSRACVQLLLAGYFFTRVFRYTVRTGLLARYSA